MALHISPELEQRLTTLAESRQCDPLVIIDALVEAAEEADKEHLAYLQAKWREGLAASERGEFVTGTPREIMARIQERVEQAQ